MPQFDKDQLEFILENLAEDPTTAMVTWQTLEEDLSFAKKWEMEYRKKIFDHYFPAPKTGVNNFQLPANYLLKGTPMVNVKLLEEVFPKVRADLAAQNADFNTFLKWKPSLGPAYSELEKEEAVNGPSSIGRAIRQAIVTTPGSPKMEIVLPAKFKK